MEFQYDYKTYHSRATLANWKWRVTILNERNEDVATFWMSFGDYDEKSALVKGKERFIERFIERFKDFPNR